MPTSLGSFFGLGLQHAAARHKAADDGESQTPVRDVVPQVPVHAVYYQHLDGHQVLHSFPAAGSQKLTLSRSKTTKWNVRPSYFLSLKYQTVYLLRI